jgi:hypothetical protein
MFHKDDRIVSFEKREGRHELGAWQQRDGQTKVGAGGQRAYPMFIGYWFLGIKRIIAKCA